MTTSDRSHPDILLITIDSLRADFCGWLNPEFAPLTPRLNGLAGKSQVFRRAFATGPLTPFSFPGILTGTYSRIDLDSWQVLLLPDGESEGPESSRGLDEFPPKDGG